MFPSGFPMFRALALLSVLIALPAAAQDGPVPVRFRFGVQIPMRDGGHLNATLYLPVGDAPRPVIVTMTPYIGDTYHRWAVHLAQHGYVFAAVDVRGRGNSPGSFEPMAPDGRDGHDVVTWLARQPWSNGKVGMWGGSYGGFTQWTTIKEFPEGLATIVPIASAHPGIDFPYLSNVFSAYLVQWLTFTNGRTPNLNLFGETAIWDSALARFYRDGRRPFAELDEALTGATIPNFQRWIAHPKPDRYWDATIPDSAAYAEIAIPILTITGQYDGDQPGAIGYYRNHMKWGNPAATARHYLVIGPWDHGATRVPRLQIGGLTFGNASLVDIEGLNREWYDWTMQSGPRPPFLEDRVAYYLTGPGAETWKYAPTLEAATMPTERLFLGADGPATDLFRSGRLTPDSTATGRPTTGYRYDPRDVRPADWPSSENNLTDQMPAHRLAGDGLVYHSAPFERATEVTGFGRLVLWISMDVPDTDIQATLSEVLPDGSVALLTEEVVRTRWRDSHRVETLMPAGKITRVTFERFPFFSRLIGRGSRLRLLIRSPNDPRVQKHFNGAGPVERQTMADARPATITIHHGNGHRSYFEVARP